MKSLLTGVAMTALIAAPAFAQETDVSADTVLATVGGTEITVGHLIAMRALLPAQFQELPDEVLFDGMLEQIIQQEILATVAADEMSLRETVGLENERRAFLAAILLDGVASEEISDADLQAEYDAVYGSVEPEPELNASHILVETEEEAAAVIDELAAGADFAELAAERSVGPSGPNGGQLGWFTRGMMVPEFEEAVFALEVGEVSPPVETQFGWHVVVLNDMRDQAAPPLEVVREELLNGLRQSRVEAFVAEQTDDAEVERVELEIDPSIIRDLDLLEN
ncbi:MAG: peptidylprolyl isomerase [Pseudomonadota bacterium]